MSDDVGSVVVNLRASFGREEVPHSPLKCYKIAIYCEKITLLLHHPHALLRSPKVKTQLPSGGGVLFR